MKHKMRLTAALLATTLSSAAIGDKYVVMPDGGGCWIPSHGGVAYGCSGGNSGNSGRCQGSCRVSYVFLFELQSS